MDGRTPRLDPYVERYAARTHGMTASEIRALFSVADRPEVISMGGGSPFVSALPLDLVAELAAKVIADRGAQALQYMSGQGDARLRELICGVMALEGISASPDDVIVTVGSQQALDIVARIFLDPGDVVLAEAPSYVGALGAFAQYQATVVHVAMDDDGLVPEALRETLRRMTEEGRRPKFLYVVPNFHNPAGVTLADGRRDEILEICAAADVLVVEDNPYGLLGFDGTAHRALRARSTDGVIYLGSFSKIFASGIRVGWVVAPTGVKEKLIMASEATTLCPVALSQFLVAEFLAHHPWQEQVRIFRDLYRVRRDACLEALAAHFPPETSWTRPAGGFYVWVTLPPGIDAKAMLPRAIQQGRVAYVPGTGFYADGQGAGNLRLSYSLPEPERIREGVRRLGAVVAEERELVEALGGG
ncbi:aminotransferase, class I and II [Acidothermus cellulolyticus 11B]|uniref:Aminotransferase, class I and II n=1 Tax=Acidothermus cellulolyticus (strain ATCC 43068 / DSM 8971 / 11B) TaxID=351607 RepID=A0LWW4_ACIC1|nr:PLP-dependent aminotransferase family protein [Acidothermus cellulolyticus]ABK53924.1 aminotransferase, class I and II [Acidothermus cellulolyticus 11B]